MSATSAGRIAALNAQRAREAAAAAAAARKPRSAVAEAEKRRLAMQSEQTSGAAEKSTSDDVRRDSLSTLTSYIPSEALAFYLAGIPVLQALDPTSDAASLGAAWALFGIAQAANLAFLLAAQFRQSKAAASSNTVALSHPTQVRQFLLALLITGGSFTLFAMAEPNGIWRPSASWQAFILLVGVFLLAGLARAFGIRPLQVEPTPAKDSPRQS